MVSRLSLAALQALLILGPLAAAVPAQAQDAGASPPVDDGCAGAVARWQDFADRENRGGHMDTSVYEQVRNEVARADQLCQDGQDAQARRLVAESKRKHGYPP